MQNLVFPLAIYRGNLFFAILFLPGLALPFHGVPLIALGLLCFFYAPPFFGVAAILWAVIELILYVLRVGCLLLGERGTVETRARMPYDKDWTTIQSTTYDQTSFNRAGWIGGAIHSFVVAIAFFLFEAFGLLTVPPA